MRALAMRLSCCISVGKPWIYEDEPRFQMYEYPCCLQVESMAVLMLRISYSPPPPNEHVNRVWVPAVCTVRIAYYAGHPPVGIIPPSPWSPLAVLCHHHCLHPLEEPLGLDQSII